jgi:CubicO group peptidase (beta-lactamase class C family)
MLAAIAAASGNGQSQNARGSFAPPPDLAARAEDYMRARVRVSGFSGSVLVAHAGKPLLRAAYGLADRSFEVQNTPETKFRIGSVTKPFTAAAILLLQTRGQLDIDDPVSRHLASWPAAWAGVRLRHLLAHTAGLPRLTIAWPLDVSALSRSTLVPRPASVVDLATAAERLQAPDFVPGEGWAYSNIAYVVLGEVIEQVAGKPYGTFMREDVFLPLGMLHSGAEDPRKIEPRLARGYARAGAELTEAGYVDLRLVGGAGALYSTVDDLARWDRALASGRFLPTAAQQEMFTPVRNEYALGWWVQTRFGRRVQWHRGNVQGFVSILVRYPDEQLFVTVQSNFEGTPVLAIANELAAMAFGLPYELPRERQAATLDLASFDRHAGRYVNVEKPADTWVLRRDGARLLVEDPGAWSFEVFPESATRLFARVVEWDALLVIGDHGEVTEIRTRNQGESATFRPAN